MTVQWLTISVYSLGKLLLKKQKKQNYSLKRSNK